MSVFSLLVWGAFFIVVIIKLIGSIRIVPAQKAYIVEYLGKYHKTLKSGFHLLVPFFEKVTYIHDLREEAINVPPQDCFTADNVRVEVDGILYMAVINPEMASYGVTDYRYAAIQLAQTTVRAVIGTLELDRTFEERELINAKIVSVLNEVADHWGIKIFRYEVKNIIPPESVRASMERQLTAERERRALNARSLGDKESRINESEGKKAELVNKSEGEKQKRINEAEGQAAEILSLSKATAHAIETLAAAIAMPGGEEAVKLRVSENFISQIKGIARNDAQVIIPADLTNIDDLMQGLGIDLEQTKKKS